MGTGIKRIIELCKKNGLKEPEFVDDGRYFKVIIYKVTKDNLKPEINYFSETAGKVPETAGKVPETAGKVPETAGILSKNIDFNEKIKEFLLLNNKITRKDVEAILNVKERRARDILKKYVEKGFLQKYGQGRNTYYKLK
ncbi:hypothetical protein [Marinitoga lauensis]|uniref:hypothetical protein n=1 Tax=Marinitoga lauensis TaxID=2201189 RepID=UPI001011D8C4|nr:hypothetical protein [Marinitoga lauensis]